MKKLLLLLLIAGSAYADGPLFRFKDTETDQEFQNVYQSIRNPNIDNGTAKRLTVSTETITSLSVSTITLVSSATFTAATIKNLKDGRTTNAACAGCIGEVIESNVEGDTSCPATGVWADLTSISLTAGDWIVTAQTYYASNDFTSTSVRVGISAVSGNNDPGGVEGYDSGMIGFNTATFFVANPRVIVQRAVASTTTTYFKWRCTYPGSAPITRGYALHARRI